ncbi:MAG TPA: histidine kinase dimerization/phosphoacceptor domain -containing protein, partial [Rectinemataceae bacterium]|nr:histidine kinase dimerization/phosphoacceptor domain -containing protein [Rectinemataceae bacterium]
MRGLSDRHQVQLAESKGREQALAASLEEQASLLREVHHRVRNNLRYVTSLVHLQSDTLDDPSIHAQFARLESRMLSLLPRMKAGALGFDQRQLARHPGYRALEGRGIV